MKKNIDANEGWKWWQEAWYDTTGAKLEFFIVGLAGAVIFFAVSMLPVIRSFASHMLMPFFYWGAFEFARGWRERKSKDFSTLINAYKNTEVMKRLLPLSLAGVIFGAGYLVCNQLANQALSFGALRFLLGIVETATFLFAVPLVALGKSDAPKALMTSLQTVGDNIAVFAVFYGISLLATLVGIATLGIGFLVLLPLYIYFPYFLYQRFFSEREA